MHVASVRAWCVIIFSLKGILESLEVVISSFQQQSTTSINIHLDLLFNYAILIKQLMYIYIIGCTYICALQNNSCLLLVSYWQIPNMMYIYIGLHGQSAL